MKRIAEAARGAVRDVRAAWGLSQTVLAAVTAAALLLPLVLRDQLTLTSLASWAYLALAAVGLTFVVGLAGMPSNTAQTSYCSAILTSGDSPSRAARTHPAERARARGAARGRGRGAGARRGAAGAERQRTGRGTTARRARGPGRRSMH